MDITWHQGTCFKIKGKDATVILNPNSKTHKPLKGEIIMNSLEDPAPVKGAERTFDWPGEYEMKDVLINSFRAWTKPKNDAGKSDGDETLIFRFVVDGIRICHLGELGHTLTSELVDKIGEVDVLMIKLGENSNLDRNKAIAIIEAIEPRIIIPMGGNGLALALKELEIENVEQEEKLSIKNRAALPTDQLKYITLHPNG